MLNVTCPTQTERLFKWRQQSGDCAMLFRRPYLKRVASEGSGRAFNFIARRRY